MDFLFSNFGESQNSGMLPTLDIQKCPFLRNMNEQTSFSFASAFPMANGIRGPIFEEGPSFDSAFRLFHGKDGVVPLSGKSYVPDASSGYESSETKPVSAPVFNPLAAKAATISLSTFGSGGMFGFNFHNVQRQSKKPSNILHPAPEKGGNAHEAMSNEWLETGQCPIAKSYRAVNNVLPLVAKALQPPPNLKLRCPPAIVAARAALARTAFVKSLRPQPLPAKMIAIALLGMAANIPLGVWREHTVKFSLQWFAAIHAAVPFIAMLRKSVLMPKTAMAFTIAASIVGQTIGSRAERIRMRAVAAQLATNSAITDVLYTDQGSGACSKSEARAWDPLALNQANLSSGGASAPTTGVCF